MRGELTTHSETNSWMEALDRYSYFVDLSDYEERIRFPDYFSRVIGGDRRSTIEFEDYFRRNAQRSIEVYFEVIFWKLYSQTMIRQKSTSRIINNMLEEEVDPRILYDAIARFITTPNVENLKDFRKLFGIKTNVLAVSLTFPAFLSPQRYPMVDNNVAGWVNENHTKHNRNRHAKLTPFSFGHTSLRDNDFHNCLNWVNWCREMAEVLRKGSKFKWRPRDVEMAVFTSYRCKRHGKPIELSVI